jgi:hypothetical protein
MEYRQIFTDGRAPPKDPNPNWMGYSNAHWDGDVLVVETAGLKDTSGRDCNAHGSEPSEQRKIWHNDIGTGDTMVMEADIAMAPSFQTGTPKLLFRLPMSPQGNPGQWKSVTKDGQQFIFTLPVTAAAR